MTKLQLIYLAVFLQACSLVQLTIVTKSNEDRGLHSFADLNNHDLKLDPNYKTLLSWHAEDPESHPREAIRDVLAEVQFGQSLKERQEKTQLEGQSVVDDLPAKFDARDKWKKCKRIINTVYDQGPCISDFAIVAASTFSDRLCIKTQGKFRSLLSAQKVLGCYSGCQGGYIFPAFSFVNDRGIPTGGLFKPKRGCVPFEPKPCSHGTELHQGFNLSLESNVALPNCSSLYPETYTCPEDCTNKKYKKKMDKDLHISSNIAWLPTNELKIREEIMKNGTVATAFAMYSDFRNYKKGVYKKSSDATLEYIHKVKLIGWGTEKGEDYWLGVNSFNKAWGEKGLFKFPRGSNYLYIESLVVFINA